MKLKGARVLVTRPAGQAGALLDLLQARGAQARHLPLVAIHDHGDPDAQRAVLAARRDFDGWIFTSANAAGRAAALDPGPWPTLFATGEGTARALADAGHPGAHVAPSSAASESLLGLAALHPVQGRRFLVCTGVGGRDLLVHALRDAGARVERLELYERAPVPHAPDAVAAAIDGTDAAIVTSGDALQRLWDLAPAAARVRLAGLVLVVPSQRVIELALRLGFAAPRAPARMSDAHLVRCLEEA
ncbi:MAG TPA: uroporphyrinogen-III synthase [Nevskiaceae bacterium]|nr:uroporphyrinogen-III synthase [Nevskiaceae bacterium]